MWVSQRVNSAESGMVTANTVTRRGAVRSIITKEPTMVTMLVKTIMTSFASESTEMMSPA